MKLVTYSMRGEAAFRVGCMTRELDGVVPLHDELGVNPGDAGALEVSAGS